MRDRRPRRMADNGKPRWERYKSGLAGNRGKRRQKRGRAQGERLERQLWKWKGMCVVFEAIGII
jgi:hypothetical protein